VTRISITGHGAGLPKLLGGDEIEAGAPPSTA
jgi:hypothetical protein